MARKTNAERQAEYKRRHLEEGYAERLDMVLSVNDGVALRRLCAHSGETKKALIRRLINEEQARLMVKMTPEDLQKFVSLADIKWKNITG